MSDQLAAAAKAALDTLYYNDVHDVSTAVGSERHAALAKLAQALRDHERALAAHDAGAEQPLLGAATGDDHDLIYRGYRLPYIVDWSFDEGPEKGPRLYDGKSFVFSPKAVFERRLKPTPKPDEARVRCAAVAAVRAVYESDSSSTDVEIDAAIAAIRPYVVAPRPTPGEVSVLRWHPVSEEPPAKAALLLSFEKTASLPETEVVGYKKSWGFVHPGFVPNGRAITHWAELSGDSHEFYRVLREAKQPAAPPVVEPTREQEAEWDSEAFDAWKKSKQTGNSETFCTGYVAAKRASWEAKGNGGA